MRFRPRLDPPMAVATGAQFSFSYGSQAGIVSGTFTMIQANGCSAFGNAEASVA